MKASLVFPVEPAKSQKTEAPSAAESGDSVPEG